MTIDENKATLQNQIAQAAQFANRDVADIELVAVSKKQSDERLQSALDCGQRVFGENRVQEAQEHWVHRRAIYPDLRLHLIGALQTNKAADAVALFDVIETLDREKLARSLAKEIQKQAKTIECFIQVNVGDEDQKTGIAVEQLRDFYKFCTGECHLKITGLMCIPPADEPPALYFALLKKYADDLGLPLLSMGMSSDFERAIHMGATHVRIGTAFFGERAAIPA